MFLLALQVLYGMKKKGIKAELKRMTKIFLLLFVVNFFKGNMKRRLHKKNWSGKGEASATTDDEILNCMIFRPISIFNLLNVLYTNGDSIILLSVRASTCNLLSQLIVVGEE